MVPNRNLGSLGSFCYGRAGINLPTQKVRNVLMRFKDLMESWDEQQEPLTTSQEYAVRLPLNDASRLHALAELYPGVDAERLITDLISAGLDEVEAAMPYVPGERVIREDDHGDPVYEDVGMTPRFLELVRRNQQQIETSDA